MHMGCPFLGSVGNQTTFGGAKHHPALLNKLGGGIKMGVINMFTKLSMPSPGSGPSPPCECMKVTNEASDVMTNQQTPHVEMRKVGFSISA